MTIKGLETDKASFFQTMPLLPMERIFSFLDEPQKAILGQTCKRAYQALVNTKLNALGAFFELPVVKELLQSCSDPRPAFSNSNTIVKAYKDTASARLLVKVLQAPQSTEVCLREEEDKPLLPISVYIQSLVIGKSTGSEGVCKKSLDKILAVVNQIRYNDWCFFIAVSNLSKNRSWSTQFPWRPISSKIFDEKTHLWLSLVDCLSDREWEVITQTASRALYADKPEWYNAEFSAKEIFPQLMQSSLQAAVFFVQFVEEPIQIDLIDGEDLKAFHDFFSTEDTRLATLKHLGFYSPIVQEYRVALSEQSPLPPHVQKYEQLLADIDPYLVSLAFHDHRYDFLFEMKH